MSLKLEKT